MSYPSSHASNPYVQPTTSHRYHSAPVPFSGAAPPIPSWVNVNPSSWQAGYWQPNPYYKPSQVPQPQAQYQSWVPGQAWHQYSFRPPAQASQQAQQAVWNHYKRPKEPSQEYLKLKLLKNPLALEGMIPAEMLGNVEPPPPLAVPPAQYAEEIQSTPWIWTPRDLDDESSSGHPTQSNAPIRNSSEPPPSRPHGNHDSYSRQSTDNQRNQPGTSSSTSTQQRAQSEPPKQEAFTSRQELHTTFSPRVIRTPDRTHSRSSMSGSSSLGRSSSVDSVASQMGRMSLRNNQPVTPPKAEPWNRPAQPPISGVRTYSEEPSSILSPLVMDGPLQPSQQQQQQLPGRHGSAPVIGQSSQSSLGTIPETREPSRATYNAEIYSSMHKRKKSKSSRRSSSATPPSLGSYSSSSSRPSSLQFDNKDSGSGYNRDSGYSSSSSAPPSATLRGIIPGPPQGEVFPERDPNLAHLFTTRSNPLPAPPREIHVEYSPPRVHTPPPATGFYVRIGYWNKRGDHLLPSGHVVYAPSNKMFPHDLADYPAPEVGYKDDWGGFVAFNPSRPELPQSRGLQPERPYESFVKYRPIP